MLDTCLIRDQKTPAEILHARLSKCVFGFLAVFQFL